MMADAEDIADLAGIVHCRGLLSVRSHYRPALVGEQQSDAGYLVALFLQQSSGDRAVHTAGHGDGYIILCGHGIRFPL